MTTAVRCACADCDQVVDLVGFLEWLDQNEVEPSGWKHPDRTHEESARLYLAQRD